MDASVADVRQRIMNDHEDYYKAVTRCMMTFQFIEEAIRMALTRLESLIYFRVKEFTPYDLKPRFSSIRNAAMGRLIDMLKIYSDDAGLIAALRRIKEARDQVAHQALLMTVDEFQDRERVDLKISDLKQLYVDAEALLQRICEKWGHLDETLNRITAEQSALTQA